MAALLTRTSRRPYRLSRSAATRWMLAGSVTSSRLASTRSPFGSAAAARSALARSRAVSTTVSPRRASCLASSRPMPRLAPVTSTTRVIVWWPGHSPAAAECLEDLIDHEGRPEQALDDRQQVLPERVGLLPEVHQGPEDPQTIDRTPASGRAGVASVAHHPPHLSRPPGATPAARVRTTAAVRVTPATTAAASGS